MNESVFIHVEFWLLLLASLVLPVAIYFALLRIRIGNTDKLHAWKSGIHARVIGTHHADAHNSHAQQLFPASLRRLNTQVTPPSLGLKL